MVYLSIYLHAWTKKEHQSSTIIYLKKHQINFCMNCLVLINKQCTFFVTSLVPLGELARDLSIYLHAWTKKEHQFSAIIYLGKHQINFCIKCLIWMNKQCTFFVTTVEFVYCRPLFFFIFSGAQSRPGTSNYLQSRIGILLTAFAHLVGGGVAATSWVTTLPTIECSHFIIKI